MAQLRLVQLIFLRGDDGYVATRDSLVDSVLAWAQERGSEPASTPVRAAFDYKCAVDGKLGRWSPADIRSTLLEWFPRKVPILEPDWAVVVPALHVMLNYLVDQQLLDAGDGDPAELHRALDRHEPAFFAAMAEERNYDLAKFWGTRMLENRVDPADQSSVGRFIAAVQSGELDVDLQHSVGVDAHLLGSLMGLPLLPSQEVASADHRGRASEQNLQELDLPPVRLPSHPDLLAAAAASVGVQRMRMFIAWLGAGRPLTAAGELTLTDGKHLAAALDVDQSRIGLARGSGDLPTVALLVRWAALIRLVRTVRGCLVPVKRWLPLLDQPAELWQRLFEVFGELGEKVCRAAGNNGARSMLVEDFREVFRGLWLALYTAGGTPVPIELVHDVVRQQLHDRYWYLGEQAVGEFEQRVWRRDLRLVVSALESFGAVRCVDSTDPVDRAKIAELTGRPDPDLMLVGLTPLGLWAVNRMLRTDGIAAPLVGELSGATLDVLCDRLSAAGPDTLDAELAAWVAARGDEPAAAELADFIAGAVEPWQRWLGFLALAHAGDCGVATGIRIRASGGLAGAVAANWLVERDVIRLGSLTQPELLLGLTDNLAAVNQQGHLVTELAGQPEGEQLDLVQRLATAAHPYRLVLLDTLARDHPNRTVAKAAGKARLRLRTFGIQFGHP